MGIFVVAVAVLAMTCASVLNWAGAALCVAVLVALAAGTAAECVFNAELERRLLALAPATGGE